MAGKKPVFFKTLSGRSYRVRMTLCDRCKTEIEWPDDLCQDCQVLKSGPPLKRVSYNDLPHE